MLFARRRVKEDADLIYRVLVKENVGEEKKAGKGIAVMTIEPIEFPKRSSGSAGPMTGPVEPGASALTAQEKAYPSFTDPGAVAAIAAATTLKLRRSTREYSDRPFPGRSFPICSGLRSASAA